VYARAVTSEPERPEPDEEPEKPDVEIVDGPTSVTVWVKGWGYVFSADGSRYLGPVA